MKSLRIILFLAALSALSDAAGETVCGLDESKYGVRFETKEQNGIVYRDYRLEYDRIYSGGHRSDDKYTAKEISMTWAMLTDGLPKAAIDKINSAICKLASEALEGVAEPHQEEWDKKTAKNITLPRTEEIASEEWQVGIELLTTTTEYILVEDSSSVYFSGAAHPTTSIVRYSFDGKTGEEIDLNGFLKAGAWKAGSEFSAVLARNFAEKAKSDPEIASCAGSGNYDESSIPDSMTLAPNGASFGFSNTMPYYVGMCSHGVIVLPFDQLLPFIDGNPLENYRRYVGAIKKAYPEKTR